MADVYRIANLATGAVYAIEASSPRVALGRMFHYPAEKRAISTPNSPGNVAEVVVSYAIENEGPASYAYRVQPSRNERREHAQMWRHNPPSFTDWYEFDIRRADKIAGDPIAQGYTVTGTSRNAAARAADAAARVLFDADPEAAAAVEAWRAAHA